jgi:hypothetical protein
MRAHDTSPRGQTPRGGSFERGSTGGGDDAVLDLGGQLVDEPRQLGVGIELLVGGLEVMVRLGLLESRLAMNPPSYEAYPLKRVGVMTANVV